MFNVASVVGLILTTIYVGYTVGGDYRNGAFNAYNYWCYYCNNFGYSNQLC